MGVVEELIRKDADGTLSFGNYLLDTKTKKSDFAFEGATYKIKTFKEITKLEKNGTLVYESVPGSTVTKFKGNPDVVEFEVEAPSDISSRLRWNHRPSINWLLMVCRLEESRRMSEVNSMRVYL